MLVNTFNGSKLYQARLQAGMTQDDLAFALRQRTTAKTGGRTVRRWETGETTPHSALIPSIAAAVNVTVDELYGADAEDEEEEPASVLRDLQNSPAFRHLPTVLQDRVRQAVKRSLVEPATEAGAGSPSDRRTVAS